MYKDREITYQLKVFPHVERIYDLDEEEKVVENMLKLVVDFFIPKEMFDLINIEYPWKVPGNLSRVCGIFENREEAFDNLKNLFLAVTKAQEEYSNTLLRCDFVTQVLNKTLESSEFYEKFTAAGVTYISAILSTQIFTGNWFNERKKIKLILFTNNDPSIINLIDLPPHLKSKWILNPLSASLTTFYSISESPHKIFDDCVDVLSYIFKAQERFKELRLESVKIEEEFVKDITNAFPKFRKTLVAEEDINE